MDNFLKDQMGRHGQNKRVVSETTAMQFKPKSITIK